jgi:hypothetical protein
VIALGTERTKLLNTFPSSSVFIACIVIFLRGLWYHSWLRYYATSRKVAGSIPEIIDYFFHLAILPAALRLWGLVNLYQNLVPENTRILVE